MSVGSPYGHRYDCQHPPEIGTMIFTADAVSMGDSYGPPAVPAGHDPDQIKQLRVAANGSYR